MKENKKKVTLEFIYCKDQQKMTTVLKKELLDQIDGQNDEYKEVIIQNETQKFVEIFDRVFTTEENDNGNDDLDAVDGLVEDILSAIINRIKAIIKQKFVKKIIEENSENESGSETEA